MSLDATKLLQLLEPAVRPGLASAPATNQAKPAFENRSFQDLLSDAANTTEAQASASGAQVAAESGAGVPEKIDPLAALSGLGEIENAALRRVLTEAQRLGGESGNTV